jgi:hypothetical protein
VESSDPYGVQGTNQRHTTPFEGCAQTSDGHLSSLFSSSPAHTRSRTRKGEGREESVFFFFSLHPYCTRLVLFFLLHKLINIHIVKVIPLLSMESCYFFFFSPFVYPVILSPPFSLIQQEAKPKAKAKAAAVTSFSFLPLFLFCLIKDSISHFILILILINWVQKKII